MWCLRLLRERVMFRDFDRQVAETQIRVAILNRSTTLGTPPIQRAGQVCPREGELQPSLDLRSKTRGLTEAVRSCRMPRPFSDG